MMKLGSDLPAFELPDFDGQQVGSAQFSGKPLLVMFICNHCPYVKHVADELARLGRDYADREIGIVAIQSNNVEEYPDDSPELMKKEVSDRGYTFPYLHDESQAVAISFTAACTPDLFLFDAGHKLAYRGRLDETRPKRIKSGVYDSTGQESDGKEIRAAIEAVLSGGKPADQQLPALGCNIKWKPGNEPDYF